MKKLIFIFLILNVIEVNAQQSGEPDITFSSDGLAYFNFFNSDDDCNAAVVNQNGEVICVGYALDPSLPPGQKCALIKLLPTGTLDNSFGSHGKASVSFGVHTSATGVALHPDGRIIVVGNVSVTYSDNDFFITAYMPSGHIDSSFGNSGVTIIDMGNEMDVCLALSIQADGRIIVAGSNSLSFVMLRLLSNGSLDTSFGNNGVVSLSFFHGMFHDILTTNDGSIYVLGCKYFPSIGSHDYLVTKCLNNGMVDVSFGINGSVSYGANNYSEMPYCIKLEDDSTIVVGGTYGNSYNTSGVGVFTSKINIEGDIVTNYGNNGMVYIPVVQNDYFDMAIDSSKSIYCLTGQNFVNPEVYIKKVFINGNVDTNFAGNGTLNVNNSLYGRRVITYSDKLYLFAAYNGTGSVNLDFGICRYNIDLGTFVSIENDNNPMLIYPNPAKEKIFLRSLNQDRESLSKIRVYNIQGQLIAPNSIQYIYTDEYSSCEIDVSNLKNGVYFLKTLNFNKSFVVYNH